MVHATDAPRSGTMDLALPRLRCIERAWGEKAARLPQSTRRGSQDEFRGALWAELPDEATETLAKLCIPHVARHGFLRGVAGKGGEKAITREVAPHGLPMGHLIGLGLEVDRCGQGGLLL